MRKPQCLIKKRHESMYPNTRIAFLNGKHNSLQEKEWVHTDIDEDKKQFILESFQSCVSPSTNLTFSFGIPGKFREIHAPATLELIQQLFKFQNTESC